MLAACRLTQHTAREVHQELRHLVPQHAGAAAGIPASPVAASPGSGPSGITVPETRDLWRLRELTPEEYRARYTDLHGDIPEDLVIEAPEAAVRKEAKPRRGRQPPCSWPFSSCWPWSGRSVWSV